MRNILISCSILAFYFAAFPLAHSPAKSVHKGLAHTSWPKFQCDSGCTGLASGSSGSPVHSWSFWSPPTGDNAFMGSLAIGPHGTLYAGNSTLYALDGASGKVRWQYFTPWPIYSPIIGTNGMLYVDIGQYLYAFNRRTGHPLWTFKTGIELVSTPVLGANGRIYVASFDRFVYCLDAKTGKLFWKSPVDSRVIASLSLTRNGELLVMTVHGLLAIDSMNGAREWRYKGVCDVVCAPVISDQGAVYFCLSNSKTVSEIVSLNGNNGSLRWKKTLPSAIGGPALDKKGRLFIGAVNGRVYALKSGDGAVLWRYQTGKYVQASPAISRDGTLFVASYDHYLYALNADTGRLKWRFDAGAGIQSSPAVGVDGTVYCATLKGRVIAIHR